MNYIAAASRSGNRFALLLAVLFFMQSTPRIQALKKHAKYASTRYRQHEPIQLTTRQLKLSTTVTSLSPCDESTANYDENSNKRSANCVLQTIRGGGRRNAPASSEDAEEDTTMNDNNKKEAEGSVAPDLDTNAISGSSSEEGELKIISGGASGDTHSAFSEDVSSSSESERDDNASTSVNPWGQQEESTEAAGDENLAEEELIGQASQMRQQGKASHDEGDFAEAAQQFKKAANFLESYLSSMEDKNANGSSDYGEESALNNFQDEWATCRLHESLCHLKAQDYEGCVAACTSLLESEEGAAAMIRARAHHRRAKAKVALGDMDGALLDARSAAFLGDRKAVAFYGKLMRETGSSTSGDPLIPSSSSSSLGDTSSLLESLLNKSGPSPMGDSGNDFLTSSLLNSLGGPGGMGAGGLLSGKGGNGGGSLAKSVLKSVSKKLEDESTHDGICRYLQSTSPIQIQSMAQMAGVELSSSQATKLVNIAHGITPKTIRKAVKTTKRAIWGFQLVRKTGQLLSKYKNVLFLLILVQWTKSAIARPVPIPKVKAPRRTRTKAKPKAAAKAKVQVKNGAGL